MLHSLTIKISYDMLSLSVNEYHNKEKYKLNNFTTITEKITVEGKDHLSYGIRCNNYEEVLEIKDITSEIEKIDFIVEKFNREQPEEQHIYDIIENYLIDFTDF